LSAKAREAVASGLVQLQAKVGRALNEDAFPTAFDANGRERQDDASIDRAFTPPQ
jgi:hypothetical protein